MFPVVLHQGIGNDLHQLISIRHPGTIVRKPWIRGQVRSSEDFFRQKFKLVCHSFGMMFCARQKTYLSIVSSTDHNETVLAWKHLVRNDRWVRSAMSASFAAGNKVIRGNVRQSGNLAVLKLQLGLVDT
jgi:hypothetical protein